MKKRYNVLTLLVLSTVFILSTCGGGGGGGGGETTPSYNDLLSGTYQIGQIGFESGVVSTSRVDLSSNGTGTGSFEIVSHSTASVVGTTGTFTYSVSADGTFSVNNGAGTDYGVIAAGGRMLAITDSRANDGDNETVLAVGVKKSSGMLMSSLTGTYEIHQMGKDPGGLYTSRVQIVSNGTGTGGFKIISHSTDTLLSGVTGTFTYSVSPDGTFLVSAGTGTDYGIVSSDGSMFVITDSDKADGDNETVLAVGVRESSGLTTTVLNGTYDIHQAGEDPGGPYTSRVQIVSNGTGTGSFEIISHSTDTLLSGTTGTFTYSVSPADGTFLVDNGVGIDQGIVSSDGSMFVITDSDAADADHEIILAVGIRKRM